MELGGNAELDAELYAECRSVLVDVEGIRQSLEDNGYAVVATGVDSGEMVKQLGAEVCSFPEYHESVPLTERFPLGGFSAYATASSFHNPLVRNLRVTAYGIMKQVLSAVAASKGPLFKKECLIGPLLVRPPNRGASSSTWHRAEAPAATGDDVVFGGWWSFSPVSSVFSCVPGSHKGITEHAGFAPIDLEESYRFDGLKCKIEVPSGSILLFDQKLIHEIPSAARSHQTTQLFLGWRVTESITSLYPGLMQQLADQGPVVLQTGGLVESYSKMHLLRGGLSKLVAFSDNFKAVCKQDLVVKSGKNKGVHSVVHRHMASLKSSGLRLYPSYTSSERAIFVPH